jgi:maltose/moltooligosaccharide transporter
MQSFFIGIGSVIAALLPWVFTNWFNVSNTAPAGEIPASVKWSFYLGAFAFLSAVLYTVFTTKEFPPENLEEFKREKRETTFAKGLAETFGGILKMPTTMKQLALVQFFTWFAMFAMWIYATNAVTANKYNMKVEKALVNKMDLALNSDLANTTVTADDKKVKAIKSLQVDLDEIKKYRGESDPVAISINLANHFSDSLNTQTTALEKNELNRVQQQYNDGADWLNVCSSVRNGVAAVFAFIIPLIAYRTNRRVTHLICLVIGGLGLLSIYFIQNPTLIIVSMGMVGIAWASILSMPYAMLSNALPGNKMGYYMGVFNFFIVIPQIVAASILGYLTIHVFHANTLNTIALGGVSMILAGFLTLIVKDDDKN